MQSKIKNNPFLGYLQNFYMKKLCFCGELDERNLAYCEDCGFYFCNGICKEESHIVTHLKKCKHSHISTNLFSNDVLECGTCGKNNIFELKFLKTDQNEYSFLCKECSKYQILYSNIIENNKINSEILKESVIPPVINSEELISQINTDIKKWLKLKKYEIFPSTMSYPDKKSYLQQLIALITEEIETIKIENNNSPLLTFDLEFDYQEDNQCFITVKNPSFKLFEKAKLNIFKDGFLIIEGAKVRFKRNDSAILFCGKLAPNFPFGKYQIQIKESVKNYERMIVGAKKFSKKNLMNQNIIQILLGQAQDLNINIREKNVKQIRLIPKLLEEGIKMNSCQEKAIKNALMYHLSIVIGPPGSGKTLLLVNLAYNIRKGSTEKILICAQTNQAIDNIIKLLKEFGFSKYVRVLSPAKELSEDLDTTNSVNKLAIEKIYKNPKKYENLIKLINKKERDGFLSEKNYKIYKQKMADIEDEIIEDADIVLSTLNNSADKRLENYNFSYVLIDEAAQALEPDTLLPLIHQAQMVVLIGDDKQLGPVVHSENAEVAGFSISLFQRLHLLYKGSPFITLLNEQYRMNEKLYEFPNKKFYENKMITKVKVSPDENIIQNMPWPKKDFPSFFYNVSSGYEENENNSYINKNEVFSVFQCVNKLIENKVEIKNIGVITFYSAQKQRFYEKFYTKEKYQELKIDTVDGFQGMEMDYIIISTVRANIYGNLGFLKSEKRLNVSLTRAKKGLILVGNAKCLAKRPGVFRDLISFYSSNGLIVNDPFKNCKIVEKEEIFDRELLDYEEEYDEIIEEKNERNFNGLRKVKVIKKVKNEKPAPFIAINPQNLKKDNQDQNKQIQNINNNKIEINNKENNKNNNNHKAKNKKKDEKEEKVEPIKHKKKKKAKKIEEDEEEKKEEEEEEELKKKGNKKWKIKNLYNKKKGKEEKQEEKKNNAKVEEEKNEEEINTGKKGRKNQAKQKSEKQGKKKKNEKK